MDLDGAPLCRVCRSDDPALGPLFHPCRCTGSIAHVHQDCLSTWLSHSKKSSCELCGHLFSFEKVYKPGSPARPPLTTITIQALMEITRFVLLLARALLVGLCWLAVVPWTVVWVSSAYWKAADWFAFGLTSNIDQLSSSSNSSSKPSSSINNSSSSPTTPHLKPSSPNSTWITHLVPSLELDPNSIALDIFQGQLITCAIILSFVVIFLLREWILQNTPPPDLVRLAEDEELIHHGQPLLDPPAAAPAPAEPPVEQPGETADQQLPLDESLDQPTSTDHLPPDESPEPSKTPDLDQSVNLTPLPPPSQAAYPASKPLAPEHFWGQADQKTAFHEEQQLAATPGLLELADPGLGMPFYKPHDPIDSDIFCHRILVTSAYLLLLADPDDAPSLATPSTSSPPFGAPDPSQKRLINAWTRLAAATILHPSTHIPEPILQLRAHLSCDDHPEPAPTHLQEIEFNWTRALLNDPKICRHIQHLFNPRCTPNTRPERSQDEVRTAGLVYSLLSIYSAIDSLSMIHESTDEEEEEEEDEGSETGYRRIADLIRLFVLPLLDVPHPERQSVRLGRLEAHIHRLIRSHDPSDPAGHPSIAELKHDVLEVLVDQHVLAALCNSATFRRYSRGMAADDNLFTNWRLKSTRPFSQRVLDSQRVLNPENDLSAITLQLINCKAPIMPRLESSTPDEGVAWIDRATLDHKMLVTSAYLLLSANVAADTAYPALQSPALLDALASPSVNPPGEIALLQAWLKLAKSCTTAPPEDLLQRFKTFTLRSAPAAGDDRVHSFQRLETEWLARLLIDPTLARFVVLVLAQPTIEDERETGRQDFHTARFFLLKLLYVHTALDTLVPRAESTQAGTIYKLASDVLAQHLDRLNSEPPETVMPVQEIVRQTRFLLDACPPALPTPSSSDAGSGSGDKTDHNTVWAEILVARMKRGIVAILARQNVLGMVVTDRRFGTYARAMLSEPDLFARVSTLPGLDQPDDEELEVLGCDRADKGKEKAPDLPAEPAPEESLVKSELSSHVDPFEWLEDKPLSSSRASSTHPDGNKDLVAGDPEDDVGPSLTAHLASTRSVSPVENIALAGDGPSSSNQVRIGTPAPGRQPLIAHPPAPVGEENGEMDRGRLQVAERAVAGRLPGLGPGPGLADGFVFDGAGAGGANAADDELLAEDIDGILELIGMKGSLLMLAQNVGLMTMLLSLSLLAFVHLPHMIGKIAVLSKAHRLLAPPFKGLLILQRYVHRLLDYLSDYVKLHLLRNYEPPAQLQQLWTFAGSPKKSFSGLSQLLNRWPFTELVGLSKTLADQARPFLPDSSSLNAVWHVIVERVEERLNGIAYGSKPVDRALAVLLGYFELALMSLFYLSSGLDQQRARFVSETIVNGMQQQLLIAKVGIFIFVELVIFPFLCGLLLNFTTIPIFANATLTTRLELYSSSPYSAILITWLVGTCFMFSFAILVSTCRESLRAGVCWWIRDPSDDRFNPIREILERSAWSQVKKITASAIMYGAVVVFGLGSIVFNLVFFTGTLPLRIHADRPISSSALDLVIYQTFLPFFLECFQPRTRLKECLQAVSRYMARQLRLTCFLYGERRIAEETTLEVVEFGADGQIRPVERRARLSRLLFFKSGACRPSGKNNEYRGQSRRLSKSTLSRRRKWAGGSFARVPASDAVKVVPGRKMHIPVHVDGTPIDPADQAIIEQQQAEAREDGGVAGGEQYTIVYLPPHFQARMVVYVVFMWAAAVHLGWLAIGLPLLFGRLLLDRVFLADQPEPHDVYAYALGVLCSALVLLLGAKGWAAYASLFSPPIGGGESDEWGAMKPGDLSDDEDSEDEAGSESGASDTGPARRSVWTRLGPLLATAGHSLLLLGAGGLGLPVLAAVVVDLYVLGSFKRFSPGLPVLVLLEAWTYGCIYLAIAARLLHLVAPTHPLALALDQVLIRWRAGDLARTVREINTGLVVPVGCRLILSLLLPFLLIHPLVHFLLREGEILRAVQLALPQPGPDIVDLCARLHARIYPLILFAASLFFLARATGRALRTWIEKVRDDRFLENRRLKNYDPPDGLAGRADATSDGAEALGK
ncbi:hypothetical protein PtA15_14A347 [Puccinia triticina]|uniref:RING-type E3 ubiquitin transferase n=1 Tax=Puccinia triticina TaxID=208348 RepID=A0ABY7D1K5_9BASI|nr:uncharacterized protein PtA15_14A347 [Puccinia triticina]WAQ91463.1 hypothetical protein PtA15_14A347 [Puccinia triticina]